MKPQKKKFEYRPRTAEELSSRAKQGGGMYDNTFKSDYTTMAVAAGDHRYRILPPTWEDSRHYGYDVWTHSSVGPDNQSYLCLQKMRNERCPVCEEVKRAQMADEEELANKLKAYRRVAMWAIDRAAPEEGPKIYQMPWSMDKDITAQSVDKESGEVYCVDDPEQGFDIQFTKEGKGLNTKYTGVTIARRPSPLSDDPDQAQTWLDYVVNNPIPETLNYYDYDYIQGVLGGASSRPKATEESTDDDSDAPPARKPTTLPAKQAARPAPASPARPALAPRGKPAEPVEEEEEVVEELVDETIEDDGEDLPPPPARTPARPAAAAPASRRDQIRSGLQR